MATNDFILEDVYYVLEAISSINDDEVCNPTVIETLLHFSRRTLILASKWGVSRKVINSLWNSIDILSNRLDNLENYKEYDKLSFHNRDVVPLRTTLPILNYQIDKLFGRETASLSKKDQLELDSLIKEQKKRTQKEKKLSSHRKPVPMKWS
jgi:hypothetical protein